MCQLCKEGQMVARAPLPRRRFLALAGAAALMMPASAFGAPVKAPAKPGNVLSPDAAFARLAKGNRRYVQGVTARHDFRHEREALSQGQNPFAGILSCADSRIAPEYCFDTARGDLFVCRIAGNFANDDIIASFEYAVQVLNTPLLVVLGHQACGAVDATIKSRKSGETLPGHLPSLVAALSPAVAAVQGESGDVLDNAIKRNVAMNVEKLRTATPILARFVADKKLRVVGGVYHLRTGHVDWVA
jgi:carbonic anhydrase